MLKGSKTACVFNALTNAMTQKGIIQANYININITPGFCPPPPLVPGHRVESGG